MAIRGNRSGVCFPLAGAVALWVLVSLAIHHAGGGGRAAWLRPVVAAPLFTAAFTTLASVLLAAFIVHVEPAVRRSRSRRTTLILATIALSAALFGVTRAAGVLTPAVAALAAANLLVFASLIGTWLATFVKHTRELVPLFLAMSLADLFSVFWGLTAIIARKIEPYYREGMVGEPPLGDVLIVKFAVPGLETLMPVFGAADWIIVAFLAGVVSRFGIDDNLAGRSLTAMQEKTKVSFYLPVASASLVLAVALAQYAGLFLPALPLIAAIFLIFLRVRYPAALKKR